MLNQLTVPFARTAFLLVASLSRLLQFGIVSASSSALSRHFSPAPQNSLLPASFFTTMCRVGR